MSGDGGELANQLAPEMAALMARLAQNGPAPDPTLLPAAEGRRLSIEANRRWNADLPAMASAGEVFVPAETAPGSADCRMLVRVPHDARSGAILFVHGGGFAFCSPETHDRCARILAQESGLPVLLPDYRLAPEHPFPAGLLDVVACLRVALDIAAGHGVRPGPILVAGDSAGATLALAAMLHEQEAGRPLPAGALLFYGVYDADFDRPSYRRFVDGPGLTTAKMQRYWDWYCADPQARDAHLVSPIKASEAALLGLPPLYLMAAGIDPLLSDTLAFAARLRSLGRAEQVHVVPGVIHGFLQMSAELRAARDALAEAGAAARRMT